jgi:hypothetical protein
MKKYEGLVIEIVVILFYIGIAVGCLALGAWLFNVIMSSDLPDWAKYLLLK